MGSNEVIVDGCNVAECNSFLNEYEFPNNLDGGYYKEKNLCECGVQVAESYPFFCKDNPDCYYKQLQRAKAENEKLKKEVEDLNFYIDSYRQVWEIDKYRKALEDIKKLVKGHKIADEARIKIILDKINEVLNEAEREE